MIIGIANRLVKALGVLVLLVVPFEGAFSVKIQIENNTPKVQQTATPGFGFGYSSLSIFYSGGPTGGVCVPGQGKCGGSEQNPFSYPIAVNPGGSVSFGMQLNASRVPVDGGKCDQLCGHIKVTVSGGGKSCAAANVSGTCGANPSAPKWSPTLSTQMVDGICKVSISGANISSKIACSCNYGAYPCSPPSQQCTVGADCPS